MVWGKVTKEAEVWTSIFADDWQWNADVASQHVKALRFTIYYLKALRLTLDPRKSWSWGTTPQARKAWAAINREVVGHPKHFAVSRMEKVLGVCMHFTRQTRHGCLTSRLQEGISRLERIAKMHITMEQAARLIQTTVWPMALYGTEVVYIGKKHFTKLRSLATAALTKKTAVTNNMLAMSTFTHRVQDPFVYAVARALCTWKRLLVTQPEDRNFYLRILCEASSNPCTAYGPAAALKCYLDQFGWEITESGGIQDHLTRRFNLHDVSTAFLVQALKDAWDQVLAGSIRERSGFAEWPVPDTKMTLRVPLPDDCRRKAIVLKLRSMGSLYATHCEHWEGHEEWITGLCPVCDQSDARQHFPFNCSGVAHLRAEYERTLKRITMEYPHSCLVPVIYRHPRMTALMHLNFRREMPSELDLVTFYTDGSAAFPTLGGHIAAWAIVIDRNTTDEQRVHTVRSMKDKRQTPDTLIPVQIAMVAGSQTINRAELQAIVQILLSANRGVIVSDSEWAISKFLGVCDLPDPALYHHEQHSDLIFTMCEVVWAPSAIYLYESQITCGHWCCGEPG